MYDENDIIFIDEESVAAAVERCVGAGFIIFEKSFLDLIDYGGHLSENIYRIVRATEVPEPIKPEDLCEMVRRREKKSVAIEEVTYVSIWFYHDCPFDDVILPVYCKKEDRYFFCRICLSEDEEDVEVRIVSCCCGDCTFLFVEQVEIAD